jgi:hypothetical protein
MKRPYARYTSQDETKTSRLTRPSKDRTNAFASSAPIQKKWITTSASTDSIESGKDKIGGGVRSATTPTILGRFGTATRPV